MAHESAYFSLERVNGRHDVKAVKKGLDSLPGVMSVSVNEQGNSVAVDFDNTGVTYAQLQRKLDELGCAVSALNIDQLTD